MTPRHLIPLACLALATTLCANEAAVVIHADRPGPVINRNLFGQFAEHLGAGIYGGVWVGESSPIPNVRGIRSDVVKALRDLKVPVVRWPGGCFADWYHWRDGIGPRAARPKIINTNWGGVVEDNSFGTHEFMDFCDQVGCEPYITGNLGSGTVQEMSEWVEYMTSGADSPLANLRRANGRREPWKVKYFAIGNEAWGCGGEMRPEFYADQYRRYNAFLKDYSGNQLYRVACGPSDSDYAWTEVLMANAGSRMQGLSMHYYTFKGGWENKGSATDFNESDWKTTLGKAVAIDALIAGHSRIMDKYDPQKKVALMVDEWGVWHEATAGTNPAFLQQQNTMRDAEVAALTLHIFAHHADRVTMSNIAQMVNVLQSMIMTDGPRMVLTPTYHVFRMLSAHQDATLLSTEVSARPYVDGQLRVPGISACASTSGGVLHLSLVNTDPVNPLTVSCAVTGAMPRSASGQVLTAPTMQAHNTFESPDAVAPAALAAPSIQGNVVKVVLPAKSVAELEINTGA
jgi:alpha-L-arabinofuranosidase